ncbi:MAG: YggT family protein [Treponema sp.]|jgi:YggT family protein|nr:YggT family protein [Treponema sp.]
MQIIMNILAALTGFYMLLILVRIMLSWLGASRGGRPAEILGGITNPYLAWWSRHLPIRAGAMDLSPIAAMAVLSVVHTIFSTVGRSGSIRMGTVAAIVLLALWSAASFMLGFFIIVLILRFIAYITNRDTYGIFWSLVDAISRPVLYRVTHFFFRNRIVNYLSGIIFSILVLLVLYVGGRFMIGKAVIFLQKFPL